MFYKPTKQSKNKERSERKVLASNILFIQYIYKETSEKFCRFKVKSNLEFIIKGWEGVEQHQTSKSPSNNKDIRKKNARKAEFMQTLNI